MWWNLLIGLVLAAVSYLLRSPEPEPKAAQLSDVKIPDTREGEEIGRIYGTAWIRDPHVHWYGDFKAEAIKVSQPKK